MMRFFKATDGERTVFRASQTRRYKSLVMSPHSWAFTEKVVTGVGCYPAIEISGTDYARLQARKVVWRRSRGEDPARFTTPADSWVPNTELGGE